MGKIATHSEAYNIGGTKGSGYSASKCATNSFANSCGCDLLLAYESNRLVPAVSLTKITASTALLVISASSIYPSYLVSVSVRNYSDYNTYYLSSIDIGYDANNTTLYKISTQCEVPLNTDLYFTYSNPKYKESGDNYWQAVMESLGTIVVITGATTAVGKFSISKAANINISIGGDSGGLTPDLQL